MLPLSFSPGQHGLFYTGKSQLQEFLYPECFLSTLQNMRVKIQHALETFLRVELYLCRLSYIFFSVLQKSFYAALTRMFFRYVFVQKFPKNARHEDFLTNFVNIHYHTHYFLQGMVILQEAKNYSHHEEIFLKPDSQKLTFCR